MISRTKACNQFLFLVHKTKQESSSRTKHLALTLWWQLTNNISGTEYHHKHIFYSSCHVPRTVRGFNRNGCHSKSIEMSLPVISVSVPLNNSVINPTQLSSVCQKSSRSSHNSCYDKKCLDRNHINSKSNDHCLLSEHNHQVILEKLKQDKIWTMTNMWKKKITKMLILMNLILMRINNSYYMLNFLWTAIGGTALIACKTPTNVISSVSLPEHI